MEKFFTILLFGLVAGLIIYRVYETSKNHPIPLIGKWGKGVFVLLLIIFALGVCSILTNIGKNIGNW